MPIVGLVGNKKHQQAYNMTTIVFGDYVYKAISDDDCTTVIIKDTNTNEFYQTTYSSFAPHGSYGNSCGGSYVNLKQIVTSSTITMPKILKYNDGQELEVSILYNDGFQFNPILQLTKCDIANLKVFNFANIDNYFQSISTDINKLLSRFNGKCGDIVFEEDLPITFEEIERKFEEIAFVSLKHAETIPLLAKYCDMVKLIRNTCEEQQKEVDTLIGLEIEKMKDGLKRLDTRRKKHTTEAIVSMLSNDKIKFIHPQFTFVDGKILSVRNCVREIPWGNANLVKMVTVVIGKYASFSNVLLFLGKYTNMLVDGDIRKNDFSGYGVNDINQVFDNLAKINPSFTPEVVHKLFGVPSSRSGFSTINLYHQPTRTMEHEFVFNALDEALENWTKTGKFTTA